MVDTTNFNVVPNNEEEEFTVDFGEVINVGGGTSDFNALSNRPKYDNQTMTGETNIPEVPTKTSDLENDSDYQTGSEVESAISTAIADKQDTLTAGANISIENDTISATDTTYTHFTGATASTDGTQGLVPAPVAGDEDKFLKADGTWDTVSSGPTVVQTTGTSTTDVMSQNATTSMAFADPTTKRKVQIGDGATAGGNNSTAVGRNATANGNNSLALGFGSTASGLVSYAMGGTATNDYSLAFGVGSTTTGDNALALGNTAIASGLNSVALGYKSKATAQGEINVGLDGRTDGYGNTAYRLISGVHDPVNAQDAATKAYVDAQGGGGDTVYSTKTTSNASDGGAVYIGNLNSLQEEQPDPTTVDNHYKYFWALPFDVNGQGDIGVPQSESINIGGKQPANQSHNLSIGYRTEITAGGSNTVIGFQAKSRAYSSNVVIGDSADSLAGTSVAIGKNAKTNSNGSVALGAYSNSTLVGEVNIGSTSSSYGYNSTNYRLLTGVHDPVNAHDATTKEYVDNIVVNYATLTAAGAPTTSTAAVSVGQLYYDSTNDDYYYCSAIDTTDPQNPSYTWSALSTGGGGGPTVVQTTGTSTTDVMSQNAVTSMVYADPGENSGKIRVCIGRGATTTRDETVTIGYSARTELNVPYGAIAIGSAAKANGNKSIAIGVQSGHVSSTGRGSISLGSYSSARQQGEMNIGTSQTSDGYNDSNYRLISGVYDGQAAHDAVTVGQVNATIDAINTALSTNIPHIGA